MREFTPAQTDDLYELVTERTKKSLIITANRSVADSYSLFPNPVVPSPSSTASSTSPTTSTWAANPTGPTSVPVRRVQERNHERGEFRCAVRGAGVPQPAPATKRTWSSAHRLLPGMPADRQDPPAPHRGRSRSYADQRRIATERSGVVRCPP